jgi:phosphoglycerate dehydrogenase-like enzyme
VEVLFTALAFRDTPGEGRRRLESAGVRLVEAPRMGPLPVGEIIAALGDRRAAICSTDAFVEEVFAARPRLELVSRWGVGVDSVDLAAATRHGVMVAYTPGRTTESVADMALGLMLAACRRIAEGYAGVRAGTWNQLRGVDLCRKTLGLIGLGQIGRAVARRASGFDMKVVAYDPVPPREVPPGVEMDSLDGVLARADFVSLHAAVTPRSRGMIGARAIGLMKPTAFLINTARGALIEEGALIGALKEGRIAGAALDVAAVEPLPVDHPFRSLPTCVVTPHFASYSIETATAVSEAAAEAVLRWAAGQAPIDLANPEVLESPKLRARVRVE